MLQRLPLAVSSSGARITASPQMAFAQGPDKPFPLRHRQRVDLSARAVFTSLPFFALKALKC